MCSKSALGVSHNLSGFEKLLHTVHKFDGRFLDSLPGSVGQHVTCVVVQVGLELKQKQYIILFILMLAQWDTWHRLQHGPQQQNRKPEGNSNRFVRSVFIYFFISQFVLFDHIVRVCIIHNITSFFFSVILK